MVHRNAGVQTRFRVVHTPLDLRFALVWGEFTKILTQGASFRAGFVINQRWFTVQRGRGDGGLASLFEVREPPLGCDAR